MKKINSIYVLILSTHSFFGMSRSGKQTTYDRLQSDNIKIYRIWNSNDACQENGTFDEEDEAGSDENSQQ
jgi:hypothetical protein